ncbi:hypothetical protein [Jiella avicenniae]|nr:hypothetical protein [Jiella avicenniae]
MAQKRKHSRKSLYSMMASTVISIAFAVGVVADIAQIYDVARSLG